MLKEIKTKLKSIFTRCPSPYERKLNDVVIYPVQDHAYVAVYWKDLPIGKGPCASLYVYDKEILKFDCFGEGRGHYHTHMNQPSLVRNGEERLYFYEKTIENQVERSIFEIQKNAAYHLQRNHDPRITFFKLDLPHLEAVCREAKVKMLEYAAQF